MYVVALVNRISFDEGEEMNKVTDAINQSCDLFQYLSVRLTEKILLVATPQQCATLSKSQEQRVLCLRCEALREHFHAFSQTFETYCPVSTPPKHIVSLFQARKLQKENKECVQHVDVLAGVQVDW